MVKRNHLEVAHDTNKVYIQMKKYYLLVVVMLICLTGVTSCGNTERQAQLLTDIYSHSGKLRGYASIFEMNADGQVTRSEKTYPVYEYDDGTFSIDCDGDDYKLTELNEPISPYGDYIYLLNYQIDYNHYIEEIPTSY